MLTPQEVSNRAFTKAMMGGYNMAMVDEFLDELTDDYTSLYKENAGLKAKMKVLVDKVEEYRATEESMRAALLTAQKMANTIVEDAEKQKKEMLAEAERQAREKLGSLQAEVLTQQERLNAGKKELAEFVRACRDVCQKQMNFLGALPTLPVELEKPVPVVAAAQETAVEEIGEKILAAFEKGVAEEEPEEADAAVPEEEEEDDFSRTRAINLKDLKFGRNYSGDN